MRTFDWDVEFKTSEALLPVPPPIGAEPKLPPFVVLVETLFETLFDGVATEIAEPVSDAVAGHYQLPSIAAYYLRSLLQNCNNSV